MFLRRSRVRSPALLGVLLILLSGVTEAFGVEGCALHGSDHDHGSATTEGAHGDHAAHQPVPPNSHEHASDHSRQAHTPDTSPQPESDASEDADQCECRLLCMVVATFGAAEPVVVAPTAAPFATAMGAIPAPVDPALVRMALLPYVLPFAHGPPPHS
jgi:hypothetical protein